MSTLLIGDPKIVYLFDIRLRGFGRFWLYLVEGAFDPHLGVLALGGATSMSCGN